MPTQSMNLTQSQQLQMVLAPQLRQSLEMLQLPILELRALVQQEMEQNPTLEEGATDTPTVDTEPAAPAEDAGATEELNFDQEYEALAKLDEEWRDYFFQDLQSRPYSPDGDGKRQFLLDSLPQQESLQEHLLAQLSLAELSEEDQRTGELIVGSINDDGYMTARLEDLAVSANTNLDHLENILGIIQEFHPTGVGARDLRECLLLQLERLDKGDTLAAEIVRRHLDKLAGRKYADIARARKSTMDEVEAAVHMIESLNPRPGCLYSDEQANYILPEVVVQKVDGEYVIVLNDDQLPHVRISKHYRSLLADPNTSDDVKRYIRDRIRSGAFMIKSIHQRQKTIYRIASEIVTAQTDFLDHGVSRLRPLTMAEVARVVGVHETTVSRAVNGKYMQTPSGMFELKYFFTPGIRTADGTEISNTSVKDIIANLVANEDKAKPLSDQELMEQLKAQGISIARRTIAKYRLMLRIPPSHMRKGFA
jgi:RNA polymerase sigma-54 factor